MTQIRDPSIIGQRARKARDFSISRAGRTEPGVWFRRVSAVWACLLPLSIYWPVAPSIAPGIPDMYVRPGLYLTDLMAGGLILVGLTRTRGSRWQWGTRRLTLPLMGIAVLGLLTAPLALSPVLAGYTASRWLLAGLVYLALLQDSTDFELWVLMFVVGLGVNALIGIAQVVHQGPLGLAGERALDPSLSGASIVSIGERRWLRAYGLTVHPNVLGGFSTMGLLLSLPLLNRLRVRPLWCLLGLGLLVSFSRSAWLATALVLPFVAGWLFWRQPRLRRALAWTLGTAAIVLIIGGLLLSRQLVARLSPASAPTEARSLSERGELIGAALEVIGGQPLTGVGAGNFPLTLINTVRAALPQPVHNVPLLLAAEVGLAGALLWLLLWLTPGLALDRQRPNLRVWSVTLAGAWFAWGIIGLWDSYPWALNVGPFFSATLLAFASQSLEAG